MSHELICSWLKLPAEHWPPDHYTLLGLQAGEKDPQRIEHMVQERLECLRRYQLRSPEPVTEAMNCLARAYCCLSDPEAKKLYDNALQKPAPCGPPAPAKELLGWLDSPLTSPPPTVEASRLPDLAQAQVVDWTTAPPPARVEVAAEAPAEAVIEAPPAEPVFLIPIPIESNEPPVAPGTVWRQGLVTRRALFERISQTRRLLRAWDEAGRHLGEAQRRLTRRQDALHLLRQLGIIRKLLHGFPPLIGQAGQAGYLVIALGRQQLIIQTFLTLLPSQREALARDWQGGQKLLAQYRRFLKHELLQLRQRTRTARAANVVQCYFGRHLGLALMLAALLTLNVTFPPRPWLAGAQGLLVLAGAGLDWIKYRQAKRRAWLQRTRPPARTNPRRPQPQAG